MKTIAFVDLKRNYRSIQKEIEQGIHGVLESTSFILGKEVKEFENEFARYCRVPYCTGVASGTDALKLALKALNVGPGDEVITAANTFIATVLAISDCGARPVLVDCDRDFYSMDTGQVEKAITKKTKAVIPVHLFGQLADMEAIGRIAQEHRLSVVEDACQAHGAGDEENKAGAMGHIGCFSFYPGKNLGAFGDGGAIVTKNPELVERIQLLRDYGQRVKYHHEFKGYNSRLDSIQAAILRVKLRHLDEWNKQRRAVANLYSKLLSGIEGIELPKERGGGSHVYHLYVIRVRHRANVLDALKSKGVSCGIHYPIPVHLQKAYEDLGYSRGSFPITEEYAEHILSLPMFPELTEDEVSYVSTCLKEAVSSV